jgi:ribose transport system substrate-binding protein
MVQARFHSVVRPAVAVLAIIVASLMLMLPAEAAAPSGVAGAKAATAQAMKFPTKIGVSVPLKSAPPKGKTVVVLQCDESQCGIQGEGVSAAAKAIGWSEKTLDWQEANPSTLVSALTQALQYKPVAVFFSGAPYAEWSSVVPAYQKAGAVIVPSFQGAQVTNSVVVANLGGVSFSNLEGKEMANFVTANSNGKANVLFLNVSAFPPFPPLQAAFAKSLSSACPACKSTVLNATLAELDGNQIVPAIVSALKTNPSINYIVSVDGTFIDGLTTALQAAGLGTKYKIVSASASTTNLQNVKSGTETMTLGNGGFQYGGWLDIDTVLRHLEGMPITVTNSAGGGFPSPVLTKANVPAPTPDLNLPTNYAQQFEKLWKVQ